MTTRNDLDKRVAVLESQLAAAMYCDTPEEARLLAASSKLRHEVHVARVVRPILDELSFLALRKLESK